jgi:hypothetical protein
MDSLFIRHGRKTIPPIASFSISFPDAAPACANLGGSRYPAPIKQRGGFGILTVPEPVNTLGEVLFRPIFHEFPCSVRIMTVAIHGRTKILFPVPSCPVKAAP